MTYPLSRDEHVAIGRMLADITKQLHDISALFATRYGQNSAVTDLALKTLACSTLLENELMQHEHEPEPMAGLAVHH